MSKKRDRRDRDHRAPSTCAVSPTQDAVRADRALRRGQRELEQLRRRFANATPEQLTGRAAEVWHATTLDVNAAVRGKPVVARTTASIGQPHAKADVIARSGGKIVARAQVKYAGTAVKTATAQARPGYGGMQRVVPADQLHAARAHASKRAAALAAKGHPRAPRMGDTARRMTDRVEVGDVASTPLSRRAAQELTRSSAPLVRDAMFTQAGHAALHGAATAAAIGGIFAAVGHGADYAAGRATAGEAIVGVAADVGKTALRGGVTSVAGTAIAIATARAGLRTFARGAGPMAAAAIAIDAGDALCAYAKGDIDGERCAVQVAKSAASGAAGLAGAEIGALIGTAIFPGAGTLVGGIVGGIAGSLGVSAFWK